MKKLICCISMLLIVFSSLQIVYANTTKAQVNLRVEGDQSTLMEGTVEADTLLRSIQKLGELSNVEVILKGSSSSQELYSIAGIANNKYNKNDEWKCYIIRHNQMVEVERITNVSLLNNDKIVLYYGNIDDTKKVTDMKQQYLNGTLSIELSSDIVTWIEKNGIWSPKTINNKLKDVNVHMVALNKQEIIQKTNAMGIANFTMLQPNIYTYYAEGYTQDNVPRLLKTEKATKVIGIEDETAFTRAEFVALLINTMDSKTSDIKQNIFTDIDANTLYKDHIEAALSLGFISGNGDQTFRPNDKLTMQELAVILNNVYKDQPIVVEDLMEEQYKNCDLWAKSAIKSVLQKGIIDEAIDLDWKENVNLERVLSIIQNGKK